MPLIIPVLRKNKFNEYRLSPLIRLALVTTIFILVAGIGILAGGVRLVSEAQSLIEVTSKQADLLIERLESMGWLKRQDGSDGESPSTFLDYLPDPGQIFGHAQSTIAATLGVATNLIIILFLGIFFAADPIGYRDGVLRLFPTFRRAVIRDALVDAGHSLRWWLVGQLATMALVAVSIAIMLYLTGIPNAIVLGLIAGILNFIPFLGPILAAIPIFLAAMPEGASALWLVMSLFVFIQCLEGYLINPLIQKRAVYLPPAWSLAALVAFGALFGGMGVALATPILAVARVLTLRLYVEDTLERPNEAAPATPS